MSAVAEFLENYWSRDRVFRTVQYGAQALSGWSGAALGWEGASKDLAAVSSSISTMRIVNRLFDDLPNLLAMLRQVKSIRSSFHMEKALALLGSVAYQLYYPLEHAAWLADAGVLSPQHSPRLWRAACYLWLVGVLAALLVQLRRLLRSCSSAWRLHRTYQGATLHRRRSPRSSPSTLDRSGGGGQHYYSNAAVGYSSLLTPCLCVVEYAADLLMALEFSCLQGRLWPGRPAVGNLVVGLLGLVSSIIGLFRIMPTTTDYFATTASP